ncbi:hypothetical protein SVI_2435 [Shewanella violacea DSS12]|uniref:Uncharacterized protein n=1 Tax=Shewanella violacea (strain JCM 10179 / CIP 106290 / LMG 19151 / DSS12) TaxID=637905 RepID=D4ZL57_SHEVD|nr:hypothetical protein SVI_2435 [Shewanella violacea DSS12]
MSEYSLTCERLSVTIIDLESLYLSHANSKTYAKPKPKPLGFTSAGFCSQPSILSSAFSSDVLPALSSVFLSQRSITADRLSISDSVKQALHARLLGGPSIDKLKDGSWFIANGQW